MDKNCISRNLIVSTIIAVLGYALLYCIPKLNMNINIFNLNNNTVLIIAAFIILVWSYLYTIIHYLHNLYLFLVYMITLSLITGFTFTYLTYIINYVINGKLPISNLTAITFFITLLLYTYSIKVVRKDVTVITNILIYKKRDKIINTVANCDYEIMQSIGSEKIFTCVNNDTEIISSAIDAAVACFTSIIVLACCCIYLFIFNFKLTAIALITILCVMGIVLFVSSVASKEWNISRDKQNIFYKYLNGLIDGFQSLVNKKNKIREFTDDLNKSNKIYTESRIKAEVYFSYVAFVTEGLIFAFLGFIMLILPLKSSEFSIKVLGEFFMFFVMIKGHYDAIVNLSPDVSKIYVSNKRINKLLKELEGYPKKEIKKLSTAKSNEEFNEISYKNISFQYKNHSKFTVGPLNLTFKKGEITFIIGGNGSGKSTIAKLLMGLYKPNSGNIFVNSNEVMPEDVLERFSVVFGECYLFEKMYGIKHDKLNNDPYINELINMMNLQDKISIKNGIISDINLSSGQKKRVALLLSYLEDSDIYLFDEWAAEQDPTFKKYFYYNILPKMKVEGKCIIGITHDDRYFNIADKIIKIEDGKVVE